MPTEDLKGKLRAKLKRRRRNYPRASKVIETERINKRFDSFLKNQQLEVIHIYLSFSSELSTTTLVESAWDKGIEVVCPRVGSDGLMRHHVVTSWNEMMRHDLGMLEPLPHLPQCEVKRIDAVFVPGLAFGDDGERLGYGGGYYDRFLTSTSALKIGLGYACQRVPSCPVSHHDIRMDEVWLGERQSSRG